MSWGDGVIDVFWWFVKKSGMEKLVMNFGGREGTDPAEWVPGI